MAYRDGVRPAGSNRSTFDEERAFDGNRDLGHGATAVVATAHTIGEKTYDGPTRSPLLWLSLILGGASATLLALVWWADDGAASPRWSAPSARAGSTWPA